jgi:hypothetical protein
MPEAKPAPAPAPSEHSPANFASLAAAADPATLFELACRTLEANGFGAGVRIIRERVNVGAS